MKEVPGISFAPALLPTLATLVLVPLLAMLGFWQLDRAEQKRQMQRQFAQGAASIIELRGELPALPRYQRISVSGRFDATRQFLLDNMLYQGKPGFHVLSMLLVPGAERRLVVDRGWIPAADRSVENAPQAPGGDFLLTGRLDLLPRPGLKLEDEARGEDASWPRLVVFPDVAELAAQLPYDLYPLVLVLDENAAGGFRRGGSPVDFRPGRHIAYAVQWFALAATLVVIFVVVNLKKKRAR